jgi:hypothetical protein
LGRSGRGEAWGGGDAAGEKLAPVAESGEEPARGGWTRRSQRRRLRRRQSETRKRFPTTSLVEPSTRVGRGIDTEL